MSKSGTQNGGVRGQKVNERKFPGLRGPRPDQKSIRKEMADARNAAYAALPIEAKMAINPKKRFSEPTPKGEFATA